MAFALGADDPRAITVKLADALVDAGRGAEAARAYLDAAEGSTPGVALDLRRRAADQLLRSGRIDEGVTALRGVLASEGMTMPSTPRRALAAMLFERLRLRLRGFGFRERPAAEVPEAELRRVDVGYAAALVLASVDPIRGAYFEATCLRAALAAGEPARVARALAVEAVLAASAAGQRSHGKRVMAVARGIAARIGDPHTLAVVIGADGIIRILEADWRGALDLCAESEKILRERCTGVTWEVHTAQIYALHALCCLGELGELTRRVPAILGSALARGDLYGATSVASGLPNVAWLVGDDPDVARRMARESMAQWTRQGFLLQHHWNTVSETGIELYLGDGRAALARVANLQADLERALLGRVQLVRIEGIHMTALAEVAAASVSSSESERARLLHSVDRAARRIAREKLRMTEGYAQALRGSAAAVRGDDAAAIALLRDAAARLDAVDMPLHAASARRLEGELRGGDEGRALVKAADEWMGGQGVKRPDRMARMLSPAPRR
jgi:hypothetical protein